MKHKFLTKIVLALGLLGLAAPFAQKNTITQQVEARSFNSNYYFKPHKVVTTRNVKATLVSGNFLATRHPVLGHKTIKKGTHLTVVRGGSAVALWVIKNRTVKGLGKINKSNGDFWTIRIYNANWFKPNVQ